MANTIDVVLVTFIADDGASEFIKKSGLDLKPLSEEGAGGSKVLCLDVYGCAERSTREQFNKIVAAFYDTDFKNPENACLVINDDNNRVDKTSFIRSEPCRLDQ